MGSGSSTNFSALSVSGTAGAGRNAESATLSEVRQFAETLPDTPKVYNVVARLAYVQQTRQGERQPLAYLACTNLRENTSLTCNKRISETGECPVCNGIPKSTARLNIRCSFVDFADATWMTTFHEGATELLGMSGNEVIEMEKQ